MHLASAITKPMPVLQFMRAVNNHGRAPISTNFNQYLRGIDIVIGSGTPGAAMPGAQGAYSGLDHHGWLRLRGPRRRFRCGRRAHGRTHVGGIGLDFTVSLNAPGTTAVTLLGQTEAAILYNNGMEAATFVGAYIEPANPSVPALLSTPRPRLFATGRSPWSTP